jgi:hypothetical protein
MVVPRIAVAVIALAVVGGSGGRDRSHAKEFGMDKRGDDEAYRDDPDFTSPEMEPGHGEDRQPREHRPGSVVGLAGLSIGAGGGALAGEVMEEEIDADQPAQ